MSILPKIIADLTLQLATKIDIGGTTATLLTNVDDDGVTLSDGYFFLTIDGSNSSKEHISCTKTGKNLTDIKSISRQLTETTGVVRLHRVGASISMTDFATYKYYMDAIALQGALDASTTTKGIVKISTTPVDSTSPIAVGDNDTRIPTTDMAAAMAGSQGVPKSTNKFITQDQVYNADYDQSQLTQNSTITVGEANTTGNKNKLYQSFTAGKTKIRGVALYKSANTGTFTGTMTFDLLADSAGSPTGSSLATVTMSNADYLALPVGEFTVNFTSEYASQVAGNLYWIQISASTADNSNHPNLGTNTAGGYANGSVKYWNGTDGYVAVSTIDLYFKTLQGVNNQLGIGVITQIYTSNSSYTAPSNAKLIEVIAYGSGGSGGSGRGFPAGNVRSGGSAGGGGSRVTKKFRVSDLTFPVTITVGASVTGGNGGNNSDGQNGSNGNNSSFGTYLIAYSGGGGVGGGSASLSGGSGAGTMGAGSIGSTSNVSGGLPTTSSTSGSSGGSGANAPTGGSNSAEFGGASGGAGGATGGTSGFAGSGGGGGGASDGASPGNQSNSGGGGGIGGGTAGIQGGGAGGDGTSYYGLISGGAGGGGGGVWNAGTGGKGGNGGTPGGAGGGGGGGTSIGGVGGNGARGEVIVITYF